MNVVLHAKIRHPSPPAASDHPKQITPHSTDVRVGYTSAATYSVQRGPATRETGEGISCSIRRRREIPNGLEVRSGVNLILDVERGRGGMFVEKTLHFARRNQRQVC